MKCSHSFPGQERQSKLEEIKAQFTNLYIKNLDTEVTQEQFEALFTPFGNVTSAIIQYDDEGKSKGFGFVNYENHEEAEAAVDALHDQDHWGKKLFVSRAQKKAEREEELRKSHEQAKLEKLSKYQGVNLYIKNLEDDVDDDKLRAEFEPYGTITSCKVMRDEKGLSKGFGFVCYTSPDEANKAVAEMNNKMVGSKPLYVSLAQRRDIRRQQLEGMIVQRQIRLQQAAAAGIPAGYLNGPIYYPPGPGSFPPQGRNMVGYPPQPGMIPRPRYAPNGQVGIPMHAPYTQPPPQGYGGMPGYPRPPARAPGARVPGSPTSSPVAMPRANAPAQANGVPRPAVPAGAVPQARPPLPPPAPAPARAPQPQNYKLNPQTRNAGPPIPVPPVPEMPVLTAAALANASPMEQKQMLGEVIYMKIVPSVFFFFMRWRSLC
jgi:polyadenylate-binding protein